jgi:hypothetical protein
LEQGRIDCSGGETVAPKPEGRARWRTGDCQLGDFPVWNSDIDRKKIASLIVKKMSHCSGVQFPMMFRRLVPGEIDGTK